MNSTLSFVGLFLEGVLSFFSPCVLPLVPLYIGYLTQDLDMTEDKKVIRQKTILLTFFFVLGISTVFFIAALGSSALRNFFESNKIWFQLGGGVVLVLFGLFSLGWIQIPFLAQERRISFQKKTNSNYLNAYLLGFFFSFAWSPCIGPLLASAMVVASSASSTFLSFLYMLAYTLGFILMFILIGLFTEEVLSFLKKHASVVKYTKVLGGVVVAGMGIYMLMQGVQQVNALRNLASEPVAANTQSEELVDNGESELIDESNLTDIQKYDVTLRNSAGEDVTLSSYSDGKPIIMTFFGTWCGYCNEQLPYMQEINDTRDDVKILLIAHPGVGQEGNKQYIEDYMKEKGYSMEILYDPYQKAIQMYNVSGFPTTYLFKEDGNIFGYAPGYLPKENLMEALDSMGENS